MSVCITVISRSSCDISFLLQVLLQDNQVTAHLRARVIREQVVGQAYRGYQIGLTEQLVTHGRSLVLFSTPCEVMNATIPPSRTASSPFRKK